VWARLAAAGGEGASVAALLLSPSAEGGAPLPPPPAEAPPFLHRGDLAPAAGGRGGGGGGEPPTVASLAACAPPWLVARIGRALTAAATAAALARDAGATGPAPTLPPRAFVAALARAAAGCEGEGCAGGAAPLWAAAGRAALSAAAAPAPGCDWVVRSAPTGEGAEGGEGEEEAETLAPTPAAAASSPLHGWAAALGGGGPVPWRRFLLSLIVSGPAPDNLTLAHAAAGILNRVKGPGGAAPAPFAHLRQAWAPAPLAGVANGAHSLPSAEFVARFRRVLEDAAEGGYGHYAHPPVAADGGGEAALLAARSGRWSPARLEGGSPSPSPPPPPPQGASPPASARSTPRSSPRTLPPASASPTPPRLSPARLAAPLLVRRASLLGARFWFQSTAAAPQGAAAAGAAALALGNAGQNLSDLTHPSVSRPASSSLYSPLHAAPSPNLRGAAEAAAAAAAAEEAAGSFSQRTPHALRPVEHIAATGWHGRGRGGRGGGGGAEEEEEGGGEEERRARAKAEAEGGAEGAAEAAARVAAGGDGDAAWRRAREEGAAYIAGGVAAGEAALKEALVDAFVAWPPGAGGCAAGGGEDPLVDAAALCALLHEAAEGAEAEAGGRAGGEGRGRRVYRAQGSARDLP
jgi:hypothetical protein